MNLKCAKDGVGEFLSMITKSDSRRRGGHSELTDPNARPAADASQFLAQFECSRRELISACSLELTSADSVVSSILGHSLLTARMIC